MFSSTQTLKIFRISILVFALCYSGISLATPPMRENWQKLEQPDGSVVFLTKRGDATFHWLENRAGYVVVKNVDSGVYEFAEIKEDNGSQTLVPGGVSASTDNVTLKSRAFKPVLSKDLTKIRKQQLMLR
ncbi:hypothetical protein TDB9533_02762 [Thalassocella blandensis]|nr:hypothetical protein TDB9533_02762 [Thalassocella blandensis]